MKTNIFTLTLLALSSTTLQAREIEYQYQHVGNGIYKCINEKKQEGLNLDYLGECGQVSGKKFESPSLHQDISGLESVGGEYLNADFSGSSFIDCNFTKSQLQAANMNSVLIRKSNFSTANLARTSAKGALLIQVSLGEANLSHTKWTSSSLSQVKFDRSTLGSSSFESALLTDVTFQNADLKLADFEGASLTEVSFKGSDLRGANFTNVLLGRYVQWTDAKYDNSTKLPFSQDKAAQNGMIKYRSKGRRPK